MTLDHESAASSLSAIEATERRTFAAVFYGIASPILILWGGLTAAGYVFTQFYPEHAALTWPVLQVAGLIAVLAILSRKGRALTPKQRALGWRLIAAQLALIVFALLMLTLVGPLKGRQLDAFWPLVFMLGYGLIGIWVGRFFILCAATVALLTMAGYFWSGPWFALWMAVVEGGALILGGLWLRWRGASL